MERGTIDAVVFDVGGVLIDWDPRHLYRKVFHDVDRMEMFLTEVCTPAWHSQHDLGVPFSTSIPPLVAEHPEWADQIRAWADRFAEMWSGAVGKRAVVQQPSQSWGTQLPATLPSRELASDDHDRRRRKFILCILLCG